MCRDSGCLYATKELSKERRANLCSRISTLIVSNKRMTKSCLHDRESRPSVIKVYTIRNTNDERLRESRTVHRIILKNSILNLTSKIRSVLEILLLLLCYFKLTLKMIKLAIIYTRCLHTTTLHRIEEYTEAACVRTH